MSKIINLLHVEFNKHFKVNLKKKNFLDKNSYNFNKWDSLEHIKFILKIEKKFKCKFLVKEIIESTSIKKIIKILNKKYI